MQNANPEGGEGRIYNVYFVTFIFSTIETEKIKNCKTRAFTVFVTCVENGTYLLIISEEPIRNWKPLEFRN